MFGEMTEIPAYIPVPVKKYGKIGCDRISRQVFRCRKVGGCR